MCRGSQLPSRAPETRPLINNPTPLSHEKWLYRLFRFYIFALVYTSNNYSHSM